MKRLFLFLLVVTGTLLLLLHFIGGYAVERLSEQAITRFNEQHPDRTLEVESLSVSLLRGNMRLHDVSYAQAHLSQTFTANKLALSVKPFELISALFQGGNLRSNIPTSAFLVVENMVYTDATKERDSQAEFASINLKGNLTSFQKITPNTLTDNTLELTFEVRKADLPSVVTRHIRKQQNILPDLEKIAHLQGRISIEGKQKLIRIHRFQMEAEHTKITAHGDLFSAESHDIFHVQKARLPIRITTATREHYRQQLSPEMGTISFSDLYLECDLIIEDNQLKMPLGNVLLQLNKISLETGSALRNQLQQYATFFSFQPDKIETERLELDATLQENSISVHGLILRFPAGNIVLTGNTSVGYTAITDTTPIENGQLIIENPNAQTRELLRNLELLFDLTLPETNGNKYIPLEGTIRRPEVAFSKMTS